MPTWPRFPRAMLRRSSNSALKLATASPYRSRNRPRRSCSISARFAGERFSSLSTLPIQMPNSIIFLATRSPQFYPRSSAARWLGAGRGEGKVRSLETLGPDGQGSLRDRSEASVPHFKDAPRGPDHLAAILYTSGTTGRSKGAMLNSWKSRLDRRCSPSSALLAGPVLLHALPIYHTHGLFVAINTLLLSGGKILFLPKFDSTQCLALMRGRPR